MAGDPGDPFDVPVEDTPIEDIPGTRAGYTPADAPLERLTLFLFVLLRDHVPVGKVESILRKHVRRVFDELGKQPAFAEGEGGLHALALKQAKVILGRTES